MFSDVEDPRGMGWYYIPVGTCQLLYEISLIPLLDFMFFIGVECRHYHYPLCTGNCSLSELE